MQEIELSVKSETENVESTRDNSEKPSISYELEKPSYFTPCNGEDKSATVGKVFVKVVKELEGKVAGIEENISFLLHWENSEEACSKVESSLKKEVDENANCVNVKVENYAEDKRVKAEKLEKSYAFSKNDVKVIDNL